MLGQREVPITSVCQLFWKMTTISTCLSFPLHKEKQRGSAHREGQNNKQVLGKSKSAVRFKSGGIARTPPPPPPVRGSQGQHARSQGSQLCCSPLTPFIVPSLNFCLHISSLNLCHLFASFLHPLPPELNQTRPAHSLHAALSNGRFHRDLRASHADNMNVLSFLWHLFSDSGNKNVCSHFPPTLSLCTLSDSPCKQTVNAASSTRDSGKGGIFCTFQDLRRAKRESIFQKQIQQGNKGWRAIHQTSTKGTRCKATSLRKSCVILTVRLFSQMSIILDLYYSVLTNSRDCTPLALNIEDTPSSRGSGQ